MYNPNDFSSNYRFNAGTVGVVVRPVARRGFTLVELLVVVAIIGLLAGLVGFNLEGSGKGAALDAAQRDLVAMLQATRANALIEGVPARLIIYSDTNSPVDNQATTQSARMLRYYGIIYQAKDPNTGAPIPKTWVPANPNGGSYLPDGIYFMPRSSPNYAQNIPSDISSSDSLQTSAIPKAAIGIMQLSNPLNQNLSTEGPGESYYYIEFQPNGVFYDPATNHTQANILISSANALSEKNIDFQGNTNPPNGLVGGVRINFLGGIQQFRSRDQMK